MHQEYQKTHSYFLKLCLVGTLLYIGIGCDSLLPEKFKEKDFNVADITGKASDWLTRDTLNDSQGITTAYQYISITRDTFRVVPIVWTNVNSRSLASLASLVDSTTRADSTDNQIIHSRFDALADSLEPLLSDTLLLINYPDNLTGYPADQRATYALLHVGQSKDICMYTSLFYYFDPNTTITNVNEYVTIDIVKKDTSLVSSSSAISPENTYSSIEMILVNGAVQNVRTINTSYKFHLEPGVYFVRFSLSNPTAISNPQKQPRITAVLLPPPSGPPVSNPQLIANKFKVVILSL